MESGTEAEFDHSVFNGQNDSVAMLLVFPATVTLVADILGIGDGESASLIDASSGTLVGIARYQLVVSEDLELFAVPGIEFKHIEFDDDFLNTRRNCECLKYALLTVRATESTERLGQ